MGLAGVVVVVLVAVMVGIGELKSSPKRSIVETNYSVWPSLLNCQGGVSV